MKFEKHFPTALLKDYIKYYVVAEQDSEQQYKVFPSSGLVIGFQYRGQLATLKHNTEIKLAAAGITGLTDSYQTFKNIPGTGSILVYFTEIGFTQFSSHPANELFNLSLSLADIFDKQQVSDLQEKLAEATTHLQQIQIVEDFLIAHLRDTQTDQLIAHAVRLIYQSSGTIRIKELNQKLFVSPSAFEKRFRKVVGTSPKKFASVIRFQATLSQLGHTKTLTEICYENNFFDQAHFIKTFKQFTGETPEKFKTQL